MPAALTAFEQALKIYRQTSNKRGEGNALKNIGNIYADLNQAQQAIKYYQQGLQLAQTTKNTDLEARILANIGLTYRDMGDFTRAQEYCSQALVVAKQSGNRETEALALKGLGIIAINSDIGKGIDYLEQALVASRQAAPDDKLRVRNLEATLLSSLAGFYYAIGIQAGYTQTNVLSSKSAIEVLNKSLEYYQESATIAKETGDNYQQGKALAGAQAQVYNLLQTVLVAQNKSQEALEVSERGRARAFINLLAARSQRSNLINISPPKLKDIQEIAKQQNATLVEYSIANSEKNSEIYIWVIKPTGEIAFQKVDLNTQTPYLSYMIVK